MVNLTALQNIPPLVLNTSILDDAATELIPAMQVTANSASDGYYTLGVLMLFFLFLLITLFRNDEDIRLDIARTIMVSSGLTTVLGVLMLVTNFSNTIQPMLWTFLIFVLSAIAMYNFKSNNLA